MRQLLYSITSGDIEISRQAGVSRVSCAMGERADRPLPRVRYGIQSADAERSVTWFRNNVLVLPLIDTLLIVP